MDYVTFTNTSTSEVINTNELGIIVSDIKMYHAVPETNYVTIEGSSGYIDLSEATGVLPYRTKDGSMTFNYTNDVNAIEIDREVNSVMNGQECKMTLSYDSEYYYKVRPVLEGLTGYSYVKSDKLTIEVLDPYKYGEDESISYELDGDVTIECVSGDKTVIPTITVDAEMTITQGTTSLVLSAGTYQSDAIVFERGTNTFTVSGTGNISITWEVGYLV